MRLDKEDIQPMLEAVLAALAESMDEALVHQIKPILLTNLERGRVATFLQGNPDRIGDYIRCVAGNFSAAHGYLHKLQIDQSHTLWESLYEQLRTWAFNFFIRKGFYPDDHTQEIATECATEAAILLIHAHFPYDTEFDAWAHTLVLNTCRKFIHKALKKSNIPESQMMELDEHLVDKEQLLLEVRALDTEEQEELQKALDQLTEARRTVIQLLFFEGLRPLEVAQKLQKSVSAIYTLQFHALQDLRKILTAIRDNLND